ncbi:P-loop containing nucleoside triphosphate hydrolase protein [Penicillium verhagenii]|nr:P-loop containing nucleoside triphosphate hydrolase protein [Penicillium verhagenii]
MNSVSFDGRNSGNQVGINYGSIHIGPRERERPDTPPPPPLLSIPFRRDPDFVESGTLLDQIYEKGTAPGSRIALVGLGGVGKSQIAIESCYRIREKLPVAWVFWIHAGNAARFEQSCRDIADRVKIPARKEPTANIFKIIHDWLANELNGKWVLILDNVDDSRFLLEALPGERPLLAYFPISHNGSMIITSRSRHAVSDIVEDADIIMIEPMDLSHAIMLFEKKLGAQSEKDTMQLVAALDYMPLAIVQAAAYIKQRSPRTSVSQYLKEFQKSDLKKTSLLNHDGGQLRRDRDASNSILITLQISFDHIQQVQPGAADLLSLMSFFDRQGIPETLLQSREVKKSGVEDFTSTDNDEDARTEMMQDELEKNIWILRNYSMVSTSLDGTIFQMHRLIQLAMRNWLETRGQLEKWKRQFIEILEREFPSGYFDTWTICQPLFTHVQSAISKPPAPGDEEILQTWASLLDRAATFAFTKGYIHDCENMAVSAMNIRMRLLGPYNIETIQSCGMVGESLNERGKWKEAEEINNKVMKAIEKSVGPEHSEALRIRTNLAWTYFNQGRLNEAEELQIKNLETCKQVFGLEHLEPLTSINNLALIYSGLGRWDEAEELQTQNMATYKRLLGPEHPATLTSINNLAWTYFNQGRLDEAEELQIKNLETCKQVFGLEHLETLTSINNLALTYSGLGRWDEAEELQTQNMATYKRLLGPEHPATLTSIKNLAFIYSGLGRWDEAEELQIKHMETCKRVLGPEHPKTLRSMISFARTLRSLGRTEAASKLMAECYQLCDLKLGPGHLQTMSSKSALKAWSREDINGCQSVQSSGPPRTSRHKVRAFLSRLVVRKKSGVPN